HAAWASDFYRRVERYREFPFWKARSGTRADSKPKSGLPPAPTRMPGVGTRVRPSDGARFVEEACVVGDQIRPVRAGVHPGLDRPLAFLGGLEIAPLLATVADRCELGQLLQNWSARVTPSTAIRTVAWLLANRILEVEEGSCGAAPEPGPAGRATRRGA